MKRILDSFLTYKEYLALTVCILLSIFLLAVDDNPQVRTIRSMTVVTIGFLQEALDLIPDYFDLEAENRILREQNLTLSEELSRLREASLENVRLRRLLSLEDRQPYTYVAANVVGKNFQFLRNTITLDVGEDEGISVDMPVVTHNGLAGRIAATSSMYAVAQIL